MGPPQLKNAKNAYTRPALILGRIKIHLTHSNIFIAHSFPCLPPTAPKAFVELSPISHTQPTQTRTNLHNSRFKCAATRQGGNPNQERCSHLRPDKETPSPCWQRALRLSNKTPDQRREATEKTKTNDSSPLAWTLTNWLLTWANLSTSLAQNHRPDQTPNQQLQRTDQHPESHFTITKS
jgi:hypothetical protein